MSPLAERTKRTRRGGAGWHGTEPPDDVGGLGVWVVSGMAQAAGGSVKVTTNAGSVAVLVVPRSGVETSGSGA